LDSRNSAAERSMVISSLVESGFCEAKRSASRTVFRLAMAESLANAGNADNAKNAVKTGN
jgi:hypothetical protein